MGVVKMGRARTTLLVLLFLLGTSHGIRAPDCDNDGVPDDEDEDDDNDGEVDEGEPCGDSDGDGILNMHDPDYNEPQFEDSDEDGDGESEEAPDCDGDGVPDDEDTDVDNDGVPDDEDDDVRTLCSDSDEDGDGESEEAPDCDSDGVRDDEQNRMFDNEDVGKPCGDSDGDGVLNMHDPDYDYNPARFEDYGGKGVWALDSYNFDEGAVSADCEDYGDCDEDGDGT